MFHTMAATTTEDQSYTASELAPILKIPVFRVRELARQGILPYFRLGRQIRFPAHRIREFMDNGGQQLPGGWRKQA